jgi:hypothetical protein
VRLRQARTEERQIAVLWGVAALATLLLRPFWLALASFLPACPFRAITGIPCPTCGTGHAALALLHGHFLAALTCNPLTSIAGVGFIAGGLIAPIWVLLHGRLPAVPAPLPRAARMAIVLALLANWAWVVATS